MGNFNFYFKTNRKKLTMNIGQSTYINFQDHDHDNDHHDNDEFALPNEHAKLADVYPHLQKPQKSYDVDDRESVTSEKPTATVLNKQYDDDYDYDFRLLWVLGIFLIIIAAAYFYWDHVECCVDENETTNITIEYALENLEKIKN